MAQTPQVIREPNVYWTRYRIMNKVAIPWLLMLPILALHALVVVYPAISSIYYSLTDWSGINEPVFVGFANYRKILTTDPQVGSAFIHNIIWLAFFLTVPFALALFAASLLAQVKRGGMLYRTMLFIPFILPSVVTASIWRNLLSPRLGIPAQIYEATGIEMFNVALLGRSSTALITIAFIDNWHWWGFLMILFLTAMQVYSRCELYDAAKIDGVNKLARVLECDFSRHTPNVVSFYVHDVLPFGHSLAFDYIWILTQGWTCWLIGPVMATVLVPKRFCPF